MMERIAHNAVYLSGSDREFFDEWPSSTSIKQFFNGVLQTNISVSGMEISIERSCQPGVAGTLTLKMYWMFSIDLIE